MIKKFLNIILVAASLSAVSCVDNLDVPTYNTIPTASYWQTEAQATASIVAIYGAFVSDWAFYDPSILGPEEIASDNTAKGSNNGSQSDINSFNDCTYTPSLARFNNLWNSRFKIVSMSNQVITNVDTMSTISQTVKNQLIGEAKFMRAYAYFELARLFGEVPLYDGIPAGGYDIEKSSTEDVYKLILADLKFGFENMSKTPWPDMYKGRVTAWSARALEAKVLMYMASGPSFMENGQAIGGKTWTDVKNVTNEIITSGPYSLFTAKGDSSFYYLFRLAYENCSESIFESQAGASTAYGVGGGPNASAYTTNNWGKAVDGCYGYSVPSDNIVASWQARVASQGDKRYQFSIAWKGQVLQGGTTFNVAVPVGTYILGGDNILDGITGTPRYNYKAFVPKNQSTGLRNGGWGYFPEQNQRLLRFADILLIDAEAKFRTNDIAGARTSINLVRSRAGETLYGTSDITLQNIWDERRFELAFENDRYFDLIRTGQAATVLAYKNWRSPKNVFYPIPQTQIDLSNKMLKQNTHWD